MLQAAKRRKNAAHGAKPWVYEPEGKQAPKGRKRDSYPRNLSL